MARDPVSATSSLSSALRTFRRPWPILLAGLACTVIGLVFSQTPFVPLRRDVSWEPACSWPPSPSPAACRRPAGSLEDRAESAGLLAVVRLRGSARLSRPWTNAGIPAASSSACSSRMALFGSFVVLLPRTGRRIAASRPGAAALRRHCHRQ